MDEQKQPIQNPTETPLHEAELTDVNGGFVPPYPPLCEAELADANGVLNPSRRCDGKAERLIPIPSIYGEKPEIHSELPPHTD